jgi:hypothetical protein
MYFIPKLSLNPVSWGCIKIMHSFVLPSFLSALFQALHLKKPLLNFQRDAESFFARKTQWCLPRARSKTLVGTKFIVI